MEYVTSVMKKRHEQQKSFPNVHATDENLKEQLRYS